MFIVVRLSFSRMHTMMQMYEELIFYLILIFVASLQVCFRLISFCRVASLIPLQEYQLGQMPGSLEQNTCHFIQ